MVGALEGPLERWGQQVGGRGQRNWQSFKSKSALPSLLGKIRVLQASSASVLSAADSAIAGTEGQPHDEKERRNSK